MNHYLLFVYGVCFALIGGAAFAMMWANINSLDIKPISKKQRHPEVPEPGEEVMYVDLSREKLERLYDDK
jgi:hypothetical protein|tara:strand:- start:211 stop:420 length:210 start_codon:yes stop_codon:yes gene_type:complete